MANRKSGLLGIFILCFFVLSGALFAAVEIKTENGKPLIDLDELLAGSEIGQPGSEDAGSLVSPADGQQDSDAATGEEKPPQETKLEISVRGKSVLCKGKKFLYDRETDCAEGFEEILGEIADQQIILLDSYAEAHAYRYVLGKLREVVQDDSRIVRMMLNGQEVGANEE